MRRTLTATIATLITLGAGTTAAAQDIVVEEIRPDIPTYRDIIGLDDVLEYADEFRFDDSDLMPGLTLPPKPPAPDTSVVPTHVVPRPLVPVPH